MLFLSPALRGGLVTGENLDRSSVVRARSGVVRAFAGGAEDWTCAAILRLYDGRRVEVVTGVDRLGETQILALSPVERSGAAGGARRNEFPPKTRDTALACCAKTDGAAPERALS